MTPFYTILTNYGKTVLAQALAAQQPLEIPHMAVGDGDGAYYEPVEEQTNLRNERWRGDLNDLRTDANVQGQVIAEAIIPMGIEGDWTVREIGLFDAKGGLIAVGKYPETYIPSALSGAKSQVHISIVINVDNVAAVQLIVDHGQVLASKLYVSDQVQKFQEKIQEDNGENVFISLSTTKYLRVGNFKRGAVLTNENDCLKYGNFYYAYRDSDALPLTVDPNAAPNDDWVCVGDANMSYESHSIFNFGGKDDNGKTDNRHAIQLAIEYMEFSGSRLLTNSTKDSKYFGVTSFHPDYPGDSCLVIRSTRAVNIYGGRNRNTSIRYTGTQTGKTLFGIKAKPAESDWGMRIESLGAHAGFKLDHVLQGEDYWYAQNLFSGGCYEGSLVSGIRLSAYMSTFSRVFSTYPGDYGLEFVSPKTRPTEPATSVRLDNCWARDAKINGYKVRCQLWYSTWTANGCDGVTYKADYAYCFDAATEAVTLENNGAENVKRYLYMGNPQGGRVAGIKCATMSPDAGSALITFRTAGSVKLENLTSYNRDKFTYEVEVLAASGNEHISVDTTFTESKLKVTKAADYFTYPNIFYYENNATAETRGLTKLNNTIYASTKEIVLSGNVNHVIEKQYLIRRGDTAVAHKLLKFFSTNNVDVIFSARMAGGGGVGYTSNSVVCSWALQSGQAFSHNTDNALFRITNEGVELSITPKVNWTTIILTCQVLFKYDVAAGVILYDSSKALGDTSTSF